MTGIGKAWVAITSAREPGHTLAAFRIAVGLVVLTTLLSVTWRGVVPALWLPPDDGGARPLVSGYFLLDLLGGPRAATIWGLIALSAIASACMIAGLGGRSTVALAICSYRAVSTVGYGSGGYDSMIFNAGWLLFLSECTATWSVDAWRREGRWSSRRSVSAWPRYLVVLQLVVIYTATGLQKSSASWTAADGYSALYWFFQDPTWLRFGEISTLSAELYPLTQLITFVVWHFEVGAPLLLVVYYLRWTEARGGRLRALVRRHDPRKLFAAIGLGMHVGIALLMDMGPFSYISAAYYLCLWQPQEIARAVRRVRTGLGLGRITSRVARST